MADTLPCQSKALERDSPKIKPKNLENQIDSEQGHRMLILYVDKTNQLDEVNSPGRRVSMKIGAKQ